MQNMAQMTYIENVDERSDIKSSVYIQGSPVNASQVPGPQTPSSRLQRLRTQTNSLINRDVEIIPENDNDEEPAQEIEKINKQIEQRDKRKSLGLIGKAMSSKQGFNFLEKSKKYKGGLLQREQTVMDLVNKQVDNETNLDDNMSLFIMHGEADKIEPEVQRYIKIDDPAVQIGLDKLARLQQIKRLILEQVEKLLFGERFHANRMISLIDLSMVFVQSLGMQHNQAIKFSRFLVEGTPDEDEKDEIVFDP